MLLRTRRTRRCAPAARPPLDTMPAHLPPGFTRTLHPGAPAPAAPAPEVHPAPAPAPGAHPPVSGALGEVHTECGCTATLHPAEYTGLDPKGGYTRHGYAWRCTGCAHLTIGYLPETGFARALRDAEAHECTRGCGRG